MASMPRKVDANALRVAIVGGSMGGLTTALLLRSLGHDVDVFERATGELTGFGAGIVAHEVSVRYFVERTTTSLDDMTVPVRTYRFSTGPVHCFGRNPSPIVSSHGAACTGAFLASSAASAISRERRSSGLARTDMELTCASPVGRNSGTTFWCSRMASSRLAANCFFPASNPFTLVTSRGEAQSLN